MSSAALKWIAVVTMLIDHIGVVFVPHDTVLYIILRSVGRIAFPLFAFMIAEGYFYTKNFNKYLLRLFIFSVVSEIPFDMMLDGTPVYWGAQSVFVTFSLALSGLYLFDRFAARGQPYWALLSLLATALAAEALRTDYGAYGILLVFIFYRYRGERRNLIAWVSVCIIVYALLNAVSALPFTRSALMALINGFGLISLVPIILYNRKKGYRARALQYFFYFFYPVHMLALFLVKTLL